MTPFPCGAPRPLNPESPNYASAKGVFEHYKTCIHPECRKRLEATRKLGLDFAASMREHAKVAK